MGEKIESELCMWLIIDICSCDSEPDTILTDLKRRSGTFKPGNLNVLTDGSLIKFFANSLIISNGKTPGVGTRSFFCISEHFLGNTI